MLFSSVFAASGLLAATLGAALGSAAAIRRRQDQDAEDGFSISDAYSSSPSPRPGSSQYCTIRFNVTDPVSGAQTGCEAEHGPCVGNSVDPPKPEIPLDAGHPAACADPSFTFYLDVFGGIGNYSLAVRHASPSGGGGGGDGYDEEGGEVEGGGEDEDEDEEERFGVTGLINKENYGSSWHYSCGGSGFCDSVVSGVSIIAPFVSSYQ